MPPDITAIIESMIKKAPADWVVAVCDTLRTLPAGATTDLVLKNLPVTRNADLAFLLTETVRCASTCMSWEALSWTLATTFKVYRRLQDEQHVELLWSGPSPSNQIPARRIDQALYDLIANAKHEILLVTFAAAKIERLTGTLLKAAERGVNTKLILEFEQSSEGQLTYDALKAFPLPLIAAVDVYCWPLGKRERNRAGKPGKLHAKVAIVDDIVLVSSANLTDDAFNRNLEVGVMVRNPEFLSSMKGYLNSMVAVGTLEVVKF